ncbi:hypothetical protein F53441_13177 [Fusarium austroafricanum]|uniref:Uncharacterized protein n=1 Tax=Fusarium austroafricanum TaxID=2364996 RepID=A0A8H4JPY8_9HYPO|nr:hypothetical protein F53441_13177 [Fusarium austroafricanum]
MEADVGASSLGQDESALEYVSSDTAAKRFDLLIDPNDEKWVRKHKFFTERLDSDSPVKEIIRENFTYHESRLLSPSDRDDIKELQAANAKRYKDLLNGHFKGVVDSLATKFTMMYFGLPVAPIEDTLKDIAMMMGLETEKDPLYNIKPPLHFLTAHDRRNWGKDSLRGTEAPVYPIPWPNEEPKEPKEPNEPTLGLRGGEAPTTEVPTNSDYIPEYEDPASQNDLWLYLHGLNGRIPFVPSKWKSYSVVLRQLLRLAYTVEMSAEPIPYTLIAFHRWGKDPMYIHDTLPLTATSNAGAFLQGLYVNNNNKDEMESYNLFVQEGTVRAGDGPAIWEPREVLLRDTVKIGRSLGTFLDREAISIAYLTFPKTRGKTFSIGNYCSQQFNAHFTATMDILFGKPMRELPRYSKYSHALFRLHDKKKPNSRAIPVVYGAMGLPQWAWELLHPLNNPDAEWMVECSWLNPRMHPLIMPNYYPRPNPHLLAQNRDHAAEYEDAFGSICEIATEAFDKETSRKLGSLYVIEGDPIKDSSNDIDSVEVHPRRGNHGNPDSYDTSLGDALKKMPTWYLNLYAKWRPGHCRLVPNWGGGKPDKEMPPLGSSLASLINAVNLLVLATGRKLDDCRENDHILLKETVCFDARQVQDMDSPSYLITPDSSNNDWFRIRQSITSPEVKVSLVKKSEVDWTSCIDQRNIWGVRLSGRDIANLTRSGGPGLTRKRLKIKDLDDKVVDPRANYPSAPELLARRTDNDDDDDEPVQPYSAMRTDAFQAPSLHIQGPAPVLSINESFYLPEPKTLGREYKYDCDVGVRATHRPSWADHPPAGLFDAETVPDSEPPLSVDDDADTDIYGFSGDEGGDDGDDGDNDGSGNGAQGYGDDPGDDDSGDDSDDGSDNSSDNGVPREIEESSSDDSDDESDRRDDDMDLDQDDEPENVVTSLPGPSNRPAWNHGNEASGEDREIAWEAQPSLYGDPPNGRHTSENISIPVNAPPEERVRRTTSNVAMISNPLLTPTEQASLQSAYWEARNILLKRIAKCFFSGCNFTCQLGDVDVLERHFITTHSTMGCGFCIEPRWASWDQVQRMQHMRQKHRRVFWNTVRAANPREKSEEPRQEQSPRRDEQNVPGHSNPDASGAGPSRRAVQHPPQPSGAARPQARQPASAPTQRIQQLPPQPSETPQTQPRRPFAAQSRPADNFALGQVDDPFGRGHVSLPDSQRGAIRLPQFGGVNADQKLLNPPRRIPSLITNWYDLPGPREFVDPPATCPAPNCPYRGFSHLNSLGVWKHFKEYHSTTELKECPFCRLPFMKVTDRGAIGNRIWTYRDEQECIKHLDCHIYRLWDLGPENGGRFSLGLRATLSKAGEYPRNRDYAVTPCSPPDETASFPQTWVQICPLFDECGVVINCSSEDLIEYRQHVRDSHPRDVQRILFNEDDSNDGDDGGVEGDDEGDHGQERQRSPSLGASRRRTPPRPPTPGPRATEFFSDDEISDNELNESTGYAQVAPREQSTQKASKKRKAVAPADQSESEAPSEAGPSVPRGRRSPVRPHLGPILGAGWEEVSEGIHACTSDSDMPPDPITITEIKRKRTKKARKRHKPSPPIDESGSESDTDIPARLPDNKRSKKAQPGTSGLTPKKASRKGKSPAPAVQSESEAPSDVASTVSRGRSSARKPRSKPAATRAPAAETQGSSSKSGAAEGRGRAKKSKTPRRDGEKDGDYEDDGYESEDVEEEQDDRGRPFRRRASSPDWVKELSPGDPKFDPDDDMYCSKCLRKAPKKGGKSPNLSATERAEEIQAHIDPQRCCRIRSGVGSTKRLPNRSGWIKGSDLTKKGAIGNIKQRFRRRYPTYFKTIYPTKGRDHYASLWRSDPNNLDNKVWWDIPWPPYEGDPPFPGTWEAPGLPWDDTPAGRKRRQVYTGYSVEDTVYIPSADSDSGDSLKPDDPNIGDLSIDASTKLKRPGDEIIRASLEAEEPAAKKLKTDSKTPKSGKRGKKAASAEPSRTSNRLLMQRASAEPTAAESTAAAAAAAPPPPHVPSVPEDVQDRGNKGGDDGNKTTKRGKKTGKESAVPSRTSSRIRERQASVVSAISAAAAPTPEHGGDEDVDEDMSDAKTKRAKKTRKGKEKEKEGSAQPSRVSSRIQSRKGSVASTSSMPPPSPAPASEDEMASDFEKMGRGRQVSKPSNAPSRASSRPQSRKGSVASTSSMPPPSSAPASEDEIEEDLEKTKGRKQATKANKKEVSAKPSRTSKTTALDASRLLATVGQSTRKADKTPIRWKDSFATGAEDDEDQNDDKEKGKEGIKRGRKTSKTPARPKASAASTAAAASENEEDQSDGKEEGKKGTKAGGKTKKKQESAQPARTSNRIRERQASVVSATSADAPPSAPAPAPAPKPAPEPAPEPEPEPEDDDSSDPDL